MKPIRLTRHAKLQALDRGASEAEIRQAILEGSRESAKKGRALCRYNIPFDEYWGGKHYRIKQVAPVIKEEEDQIVVITVYTLYF
jgi:hypothetical protein